MGGKHKWVITVTHIKGIKSKQSGWRNFWEWKCFPFTTVSFLHSYFCGKQALALERKKERKRQKERDGEQNKQRRIFPSLYTTLLAFWIKLWAWQQYNIFCYSYHILSYHFWASSGFSIASVSIKSSQRLFKLSSSVSRSLFLFISILISERESWHYNHSTTPSTHHRKLFKHLEVTYSQVWFIIGIVSSSSTHFHSEKVGLIRVT